jgi:hypothetical protein
MVLTEEEKKEYLINYQPTPRFPSITELLMLFGIGFGVSIVLTELNELGYTHIDLNNMPKMLFLVILVFAVTKLIKYVIDKEHKK